MFNNFQDFVVIGPSPKKKRLLTEHQKEVRKTKKIERFVGYISVQHLYTQYIIITIAFV